MVSAILSRSQSARIRTQSFNSPRASLVKRKWWAPESFLNVLPVVLILIALVLVLGSVAYSSYFRDLSRGNLVPGLVDRDEKCDVFEGSWVRDGNYPLYNSSECPFAERGFNCLANGRKDTEYQKWRWKPKRCDVPRFNASEILERLRDKRVVFVGDSMSRTQWESLICMLMTGVSDPNSVYEVNGNQISKTIRFLGVYFQAFNLRVEFFRSVYLVQQGLPPKHAPSRVKSALRLDKMDEINRKWVDADVLIFNSGHWWTRTKLIDSGCYFQAAQSLKLGLSITSAFRMALNTWASWVETRINTNKTHVFFRTYEPSHWSESNPKVCELTEQPMPDAQGNDRSEFADIISEVVRNMRVPAVVLNVTSMGAVRSDAHIGNWSHPVASFDCSHWCLPGVPDAWNELLFSYLLTDGW
ncbi:uncharacterized protein A4U43_C10F9750 [Asparagus officinalis]|uniref:Uncharacterized protein n=1 Tax=Asparagus officinalis TaxID=4686 RepID=A0A5P1E1P8_ASPOF|nr:protein trichome berefringence-like 7 [Asparagus officinalis]ONK56530.1 uncharacterized protein A4U43_C10F9750 [Asparagus officinalis]